MSELFDCLCEEGFLDAIFLGVMQRYRNNQSCLGSSTYALQFITWHLAAFNRDLGTIDVANLINEEKELQIVECTECRKHHAEESFELSIAPSVLVIHLKRSNGRLRVEGQQSVYEQYKGYRQVTYATSLTLTTISEGDVQFDLVGVIIHLGTNHDSGHYVAIVRDGNGWIRCDDGDIRRSCEKDALNSGSLEMSPCMLFYKKREQCFEPAARSSSEGMQMNKSTEVQAQLKATLIMDCKALDADYKAPINCSIDDLREDLRKIKAATTKRKKKQRAQKFRETKKYAASERQENRVRSGWEISLALFMTPCVFGVAGPA